MRVQMHIIFNLAMEEQAFKHCLECPYTKHKALWMKNNLLDVT